MFNSESKPQNFYQGGTMGNPVKDTEEDSHAEFNLRQIYQPQSNIYHIRILYCCSQDVFFRSLFLIFTAGTVIDGIFISIHRKIFHMFTTTWFTMSNTLNNEKERTLVN